MVLSHMTQKPGITVGQRSVILAKLHVCEALTKLKAELQRISILIV